MTIKRTIFNHLRQRDDLSGHETQFLVVIQHGVHGLDPQRVDRAVEDHPVVVRGFRIPHGDADLFRSDTVGPLVRELVERPVQLSLRDGLRVQHVRLHLLVLSVEVGLALGTQRGARSLERPVVARLTTARRPDKHHSVPHLYHVVQLKHFLDEILRRL